MIDRRRYVKVLVTKSVHYGIVSSKDIWGRRRCACLSRTVDMSYSSEISKTCVLIQHEPSHKTWNLLTSSLSKCRNSSNSRDWVSSLSESKCLRLTLSNCSRPIRYPRNLNFVDEGRSFSFQVEQENVVGRPTHRDASHGVAAVFDVRLRQ